MDHAQLTPIQSAALFVLLAFVLTVVATPREWYPVFGGYLVAVFLILMGVLSL